MKGQTQEARRAYPLTRSSRDNRVLLTLQPCWGVGGPEAQTGSEANVAESPPRKGVSQCGSDSPGFAGIPLPQAE